MKTHDGKRHASAQSKRKCKIITDYYIAQIIGISVNILRQYAPEYIEYKRKTILLKRHISNQQKQTDE